MKCYATGSLCSHLRTELSEVADSMTYLFSSNRINQTFQIRTVVASVFAQPVIAAQRAHAFLDWRRQNNNGPDPEHIHQKRFVVCTLKLTAFSRKRRRSRAPSRWVLLMVGTAVRTTRGHHQRPRTCALPHPR